MRTIKFRGKDIDTGEWVYGHFFQRLGGYPAIIEPRLRDEKIMYYEIAVEDNTVGQFTSLLDKNGTEIYEGDIYRYIDPDSINEVCYCIGGGFAGFDFSPALHNENRLLDVEIIGNIHDNPELLKGGAQ